MSLAAFGGGALSMDRGGAGVVDTMQVTKDLSHLSHDQRLTTQIMKKRQEELARRSKILDPRKRQFGVDHAILDAQILEKRKLQESEAVEDAYHAQLLVDQEKVLQNVEQIKEIERRQRHKDTIRYSMAELHKETRREYHLSDPKEYTSAFATLPEEKLGPCSMSTFKGEGLNLEKKRQQQMQSAAWLKQQMQEKKEREHAEKDWDRYMDHKAAEANQLRAHCEIATEQEMREDKVAEAQHNLELAEQRRQREQARKQREHDSRMQHTKHILADPRLNEANDNHLSPFTGKKLEQKRLTLEEEQDVYNTNAHQIRGKLAAKKREAEEDAHHHNLGQMGVQVREAIEHEKRRQQQEKQRLIIEENKRAAEAKRQKDIKEHLQNKSFDVLG